MAIFEGGASEKCDLPVFRRWEFFVLLDQLKSVDQSNSNS